MYPILDATSSSPTLKLTTTLNQLLVDRGVEKGWEGFAYSLQQVSDKNGTLKIFLNTNVPNGGNLLNPSVMEVQQQK